MKNFRMAGIILILLLAFLGCNNRTTNNDDDPEDPNAIGEVTITNIPVKIPVNKQEGKEADTFKVYVYPSDNMTHDVPPAAKGMELISNATVQGDGRYTVKIKMQTPSEWKGYPGGVDPNIETAPWKGIAKFFTVVISPQDTMEYKYDSIWAKGGYTFDKTKATMDWDVISMDFRSSALENAPGLMLGTRTLEFYYDIVDADPDITSEDIWYFGPDGAGNWSAP